MIRLDQWTRRSLLLASVLVVVLTTLFLRWPQEEMHVTPARPRVAVSILVRNKPIDRTIESLLRSDFVELADADVFAFSNDPASEATAEFLRLSSQNSTLCDREWVLLTVANITFNASTGWNDPRRFCPGLAGSDNVGIILPRSRIMREALQRNYDWVLEVHDDMLFPKHWFKALIANDHPKVGILQPTLWPELDGGVQHTGDLDELFNPHKVNTLSFTFAAHPWLVKLEMVRQIGYYDPMLSPWHSEDTDFYFFACVLSEWHCHTVGSSIVFHHASNTWGAQGSCNRSVGVHALLQARFFGTSPHNYFQCSTAKEPYVWSLSRGTPEWLGNHAENICVNMRRNFMSAVNDVRAYVSNKNESELPWMQWRFGRTQALTNTVYEL